MEAQSFSVKRAEVEFHNFASFGEPERAIAVYEEENRRRGALIRKHQPFLEPLSPFLEIGSAAGHTSYMLENEFGAGGFALDISADALRHGALLLDRWKWSRAPVRIAGDAAHLPFGDGTLRLVLAYQMLSQFMDIEKVFLEVKRVLMPGGVFLFGEEPLKRLLTLGVYRCPYPEAMRPWERKLFDWGLLGYVVRDVIGARQEEAFGIRQNHTMTFRRWRRLIDKHFAAYEHELFLMERGWGERVLRRLVGLSGRWQGASLLGGTLTAMCKKEGGGVDARYDPDAFENRLACPDCGGPLGRDGEGALRCGRCPFSAPYEDGVYNLLPSRERRELYPGDREDTIDFSLAGHEKRLLDGWYALEGVFGNKYRWMGETASARLTRVNPGPLRLRIRGHADEGAFDRGQTVRLEVRANGSRLGVWPLARPGLFVIEAELPDCSEYKIDLQALPAWRRPPDARTLTVTISMIRLVGDFQQGITPPAEG
jgi:ubiquinone/menaquinone biosynthesis C-methylase UbiE